MHLSDALFMQRSCAAAAAVVLTTFCYFAIARPSMERAITPAHLRRKGASGMLFRARASPAQRPSPLCEADDGKRRGAPSALHVYVLSEDATRTGELVRSLLSATRAGEGVNETLHVVAMVGGEARAPQRHGDGARAIVHLSLAQLLSHPDARHQRHPQEQKQKPQEEHGTGRTLVIVLGDRMEPSPMYALWFLSQSCFGGGGEGNNNNNNSPGGEEARTPAALIAGGRWSDGGDGLALSAEEWTAYLALERGGGGEGRVSIPSILAYARARIPNATVTFPALEDGRVFVRAERQNPAYVERRPKLVRAWDPFHTPMRAQWPSMTQSVSGPS